VTVVTNLVCAFREKLIAERGGLYATVTCCAFEKRAREDDDLTLDQVLMARVDTLGECCQRIQKSSCFETPKLLLMRKQPPTGCFGNGNETRREQCDLVSCCAETGV